MIKVAKFKFEQYFEIDRYFIETDVDGIKSFENFRQYLYNPEDLMVTDCNYKYIISMDNNNIEETVQKFKKVRVAQGLLVKMPALFVDILFIHNPYHNLIRGVDLPDDDYVANKWFYDQLSDNITYKILDMDGIMFLPSVIKAKHHRFYCKAIIDKASALFMKSIMEMNSCGFEKECECFFKDKSIKPGMSEYDNWRISAMNSYANFDELMRMGKEIEAENSLPDNAAVFLYIGTTYYNMCETFDVLQNKYNDWKDNELMRTLFCRMYREFDVFNDYAYEKIIALKPFYEDVRNYGK